ncbi:MAG: Hsp33 family molecular chaperone HslO [Hyphomicrobium sp.]
MNNGPREGDRLQHFAGDDSGAGARRLFSGDDAVLPFSTIRSGVEGRVVRLAGIADTILGGHDYPEPVSRALGEALALTAMLGAALKSGGRLILETRTNGPLRSLAVNFEARSDKGGQVPGRMRGYAGFDKAAVEALSRKPETASLLGEGHLALTIEAGEGRDSYQGVAALDGGSLSDAARAYFRQSEQLPTFIRLAVARELVPAAGASAPEWRWRVGGLMIQHLAAVGIDTEKGWAEESWRRAGFLAETVEDHELIDPLLPPESLLLRLFHEEGVRVRDAVPLDTYCRCSRERIAGFLEQFGAAELDDLRAEDGSVVVTCEFCGSAYVFAEPNQA